MSKKTMKIYIGGLEHLVTGWIQGAGAIDELGWTMEEMRQWQALQVEEHLHIWRDVRVFESFPIWSQWTDVSSESNGDEDEQALAMARWKLGRAQSSGERKEEEE